MTTIKEINGAQLKKLLEQKEEKSFTSSVKKLIKSAGFKIDVLPEGHADKHYGQTAVSVNNGPYVYIWEGKDDGNTNGITGVVTFGYKGSMIKEHDKVAQELIKLFKKYTNKITRDRENYMIRFYFKQF